MSKVPSTVGDFIALPVILQSKVLNKDIKHYIYIKAYDPRIPDEQATKSLFLVNIPVTTTESQLRHLFTTQLSGGHVETVHFAEQTSNGGHSSSSSSAIIATINPTTKDLVESSQQQTLGKRKRQSQQQPTISDLETTLSKHTLPPTLPSQFHATGSTAIVTFLDRPSRDLTLRACRKAAKQHSATSSSGSNHKPLIWSQGLASEKTPLQGLTRYTTLRNTSYPARPTLLNIVESFMTTYTSLESARSQASAKSRSEPDEDGFVTVTRGSKGVVKADEVEGIKAREEAKRKKKGGSGLVDDFYRFQVRERRRGEMGGVGELERRFRGDRERVEEIRRRKGMGI